MSKQKENLIKELEKTIELLKKDEIVHFLLLKNEAVSKGTPEATTLIFLRQRKEQSLADVALLYFQLKSELDQLEKKILSNIFGDQAQGERDKILAMLKSASTDCH
ncbi:MAG TPA: hypothetical protein VGK47_09345 [Nitrososphaeraceae archaeon]